MKWIFLSLLLGNAGYLAYRLFEAESVSLATTTSESTSRIPSVDLLSEESEASRQDEVERVLGNPLRIAKVDPSSESIASSDGLESVAIVLPVSEERHCSGLGPFANVAVAQNVSERLAALGQNVELQAIDRQMSDLDFRVVLPPLKSVQEAFRRLRELKSQDIDSYVITQGPDAQGISLGVFSSRAAADKYQGDMAGIGYRAEVKELPRISRGYWLLLRDGAFDKTIKDEVAAEFPAISVDESVCLN